MEEMTKEEFELLKRLIVFELKRIGEMETLEEAKDLAEKLVKTIEDK